jgi:ribonuclease P protein component
VGFAAGKRVGTAVARNRAKRLLREALRQQLAHLAPGWDLLFIARAPLATVKLPQAQVAVEQVLERARLLRPHA